MQIFLVLPALEIDVECCIYNICALGMIFLQSTNLSMLYVLQLALRCIDAGQSDQDLSSLAVISRQQCPRGRLM